MCESREGATFVANNDKKHLCEGRGEPSQTNEKLPIFSILNLVVDHVMEPPSPLEPYEFQLHLQAKKNEYRTKQLSKNQIIDDPMSNEHNGEEEDEEISVPVLRIFGPITKYQNGIPIVTQQQPQSACIHIHGAYPYLLARPLAAGPDGSVYRYLKENNNGVSNTLRKFIDWDDVNSVSLILEDVHAKLECALQNTLIRASDISDNKGSSSTKKRFIRQITLVVGRGFYTYCSGPPAPFLRVEYYDPRQRWKVKTILERGLEMPREYHPDSSLYCSELDTGIQQRSVDHAKSSIAMDAGEEENMPIDNSPLLRFRCYEAHIPYTMQLFKDYNIAGMASVKFRDGRFREPLPINAKHRVRDDSAKIDYCVNSEYNHSLFLQSNVPNTLLWGKVENIECPPKIRSPVHQTLKKNISAENNSDPSQKLFDILDEESYECEALKNLSESDVISREKKNTNDELSVSDPIDTSLATNIENDENIIIEHWKKKETSCEIEIDTTVTNILNVNDVLTSLPGDDQNIHWRAVPSLREIWDEERTRMANLLPPKDMFINKPKHYKSSSACGKNISNEKRDDSENKVNFFPFTLSVKKEAPVAGARMSAKGIDKLYDSSPGLQSDYEEALSDIYSRHETCINEIDEALVEESKKSKSLTGKLRKLKSIEEENVNKNNEMLMTNTTDEAFLALQSLADQFSATGTPTKSILGPIVDGEYTPPSSIIGTPMTSLFSTQRQNSIPEQLSNAPILTQADIEEVDDGIRFGMNVDRGNALSALEENGNNSLSNVDEQINPCTLTPYDDLDDNFLVEEDDMGEEEMEKTLNILATQTQTMHEAHPHSLHSESLLGSHRSFSNDQTDCTHVTFDLPITQSISENENFRSSEKKFDRADQRNISNKGKNPIRCSEDSPHKVEYLRIQRSRELTDNLNLKRNRQYIEQVKLPPSSKQVRSWARSQKRRKRQYLDESDKNETKHVLKGNERNTIAQQTKVRKKSIKGAKKVGFSGKINVASCSVLEVEETDCNDNKSLSQNSTFVSSHPGSAESLTFGMLSNESETLGYGVEKTNKQVKRLSPSEQQIKHTSTLTAFSSTPTQLLNIRESASLPSDQALIGIGQQGGKVFVEGCGGLKASVQDTSNKDTLNLAKTTTPVPRSLLTIMSIEVHVQCRTGKVGIGKIAMKPDSSRDPISAVVYVYGYDPGGGREIEMIENGCIYIPLPKEISDQTSNSLSNTESIPTSLNNDNKVFGISSTVSLEAVNNERKLLLRLSSIVLHFDPDALLSWDTQKAGLGYIIERGALLEDNTTGDSKQIDMVRLLGRSPRRVVKAKSSSPFNELAQNQATSKNTGNGDQNQNQNQNQKWCGSGLGSDWDDRVGAGSAAASIVGRLVFCGWKLLSEEVKHPNSSYLPAMVATILQRRMPFHDNLVLNKWYSEYRGIERSRVLQYRLTQAQATVLLFDKIDIIGRAGEAARLSGVEFSQSFPGIRGSQFKVEGVLLRALQSVFSHERGEKFGSHSKVNSFSSHSNVYQSQSQSPWKLRRNPKSSMVEKDSKNIDNTGYFFFSPSKDDCEKQEALECQAMTLEPKSGFHFDPIVVCDFTALYPSLVIAYNLCYSTCAGKLQYQTTIKETGQKGRSTSHIGPFAYDERKTATVIKHHMKSLFESAEQEKDRSSNRAYVIPSGSIFLSEDVLKGVLPLVLDELLSTRAMLKKAAKEYRRAMKHPPVAVLRQLEARQLALKYVANVTYGYTSATFSGRSAMPLLADAIVECGRRTLTNAINLANKWGKDRNNKWYGAHVVYGDTDSLFIKLPQRTVKEAFVFGEEFCKSVTNSNPPPIQLKLEKVYKSSLLQTKKKYCGMKYESPNQKTPSFEAKGIETVRRDQCALTQKILRNALITFFSSRDLSRVKQYLFRQWSLIHAGRLPISDFILTGRVRSHYRGGKIGPVQASLARRLAEVDPGRAIAHKERLPYVIVASPGCTFKLRDCVLTPTELLEQWDSFTLHVAYYSKRHVNAALQRCFGLAPFRININSWYEACPKPRRRIHYWPITRLGGSTMISAYFGSDICALCNTRCKTDGNAKTVICGRCKRNRVDAFFIACKNLSNIQKQSNLVAAICQKCNGCFESSGTFAVEKPTHQHDKRIKNIGLERNENLMHLGIFTPFANCSCVDCPITYKRHELREAEVEAISLCNALGVFH